MLIAGLIWYCQGGNRDSKQRLRSSALSQNIGNRRKNTPHLTGSQRTRALLSNARGQRTHKFACLNAQTDDCSVLEDDDSDVPAEPEPEARPRNGHSKQVPVSKPARIGPVLSRPNAVEERRYDVDGLLYSKAEFVEEYGGLSAWNQAKSQAVSPAKAVLPAGPAAMSSRAAQLASSKSDSAAASLAPRDVEERRYDVDGMLYTKAEFIEEYGGTSEWDQPRRALLSAAPAESSAVPPLPPLPPLPPKPDSASVFALSVSLYNQRMGGDSARGHETSGDRTASKGGTGRPGAGSGGLLKIKTPLASDLAALTATARCDPPLLGTQPARLDQSGARMPRTVPPPDVSSPKPARIVPPKHAARSSGRAPDIESPKPPACRFIADLD